MHDQTAAVRLTQSDPVPEPVARGWPGISCWGCGEDDTLTIRLHDTCTLVCSGCDAEFDIADIRTRLAALTAVANWMDLAPAIEE